MHGLAVMQTISNPMIIKNIDKDLPGISSTSVAIASWSKVSHKASPMNKVIIRMIVVKNNIPQSRRFPHFCSIQSPFIIGCIIKKAIRINENLQVIKYQFNFWKMFSERKYKRIKLLSLKKTTLIKNCWEVSSKRHLILQVSKTDSFKTEKKYSSFITGLFLRHHFYLMTIEYSTG